MIVTHIVGPAAWASFLVNGDDSGLDPQERVAAKTWREREGVAIIDVERDANGEPCESYFSRSGRILVPELDCDGFQALVYQARELQIEAGV